MGQPSYDAMVNTRAEAFREVLEMLDTAFQARQKITISVGEGGKITTELNGVGMKIFPGRDILAQA